MLRRSTPCSTNSGAAPGGEPARPQPFCTSYECTREIAREKHHKCLSASDTVGGRHHERDSVRGIVQIPRSTRRPSSGTSSTRDHSRLGSRHAQPLPRQRTSQRPIEPRIADRRDTGSSMTCTLLPSAAWLVPSKLRNASLTLPNIVENPLS